MYAAILGSSNSFPAVIYNEQKRITGRAELLLVLNFKLKETSGFLSQEAEFLAYLKQITAKAPWIRDAQFHAAVSCRGRQYSREQLLRISQRWMDAIGFMDCPQLYYFHSDTDNNHIHIISSRIQTDGRLIGAPDFKRKALFSFLRLTGGDFYSNRRKILNELLSFAFPDRETRALFLSLRQRGTSLVAQGSRYRVLYKGIQLLIKDRRCLDGRLYDRRNPDKTDHAAFWFIRNYACRNLRLLKLFSQLLSPYMITYFQTKGTKEPFDYFLFDRQTQRIYRGRYLFKIQDFPVKPTTETLIKEKLMDWIRASDLPFKNICVIFKRAGCYPVLESYLEKPPSRELMLKAELRRFFQTCRFDEVNSFNAFARLLNLDDRQKKMSAFLQLPDRKLEAFKNKLTKAMDPVGLLYQQGWISFFYREESFLLHAGQFLCLRGCHYLNENLLHSPSYKKLLFQPKMTEMLFPQLFSPSYKKQSSYKIHYH